MTLDTYTLGLFVAGVLTGIFLVIETWVVVEYFRIRKLRRRGHRSPQQES